MQPLKLSTRTAQHSERSSSNNGTTGLAHGLELAKLKDNIYATLEIWHLRVREATSSSLRLPPNPEQATMMMPMMMMLMMRGEAGSGHPGQVPENGVALWPTQFRGGWEGGRGPNLSLVVCRAAFA